MTTHGRRPADAGELGTRRRRNALDLTESTFVEHGPGHDEGRDGADRFGSPVTVDGIPSLAQRWRLDAARFEEDRLPTVATVLLRCAEQLEGATREQESALVTLSEGGRLSGYSPRQLSRLMHGGRIPNYGSETRPKVAVGDLPRKPGLARAR